MKTNVEMVDEAEAEGQIFDEIGESLCQPVIDACEPREWTGSAADWSILRDKAEELDTEE